MSISTDPQSYSPQELASLEQQLLDELQHRLGEAPTPDTPRYLTDLLDHLFTVLPFRFDMKEKSGYLADVTKKFPNWQDQVDALRLEHALLYEDLRGLRASVDDERRYREEAPRVMQRIVSWMERLQKHDTEERRLTQLAANLMLGGEE